MRFIVPVFFVSLFFASCARSHCSNHALTLAILKTSLNERDLQPYLDPSDNVVVLKIDTIDSEISLTKFDRPVLFLSHSEIKERGILSFLEFSKIQVKNDSVSVSFEMKVKGMVGWVRYTVSNCELKQTYVRVGLSD